MRASGAAAARRVCVPAGAAAARRVCVPAVAAATSGGGGGVAQLFRTAGGSDVGRTAVAPTGLLAALRASASAPDRW